MQDWAREGVKHEEAAEVWRQGPCHSPRSRARRTKAYAPTPGTILVSAHLAFCPGPRLLDSNAVKTDAGAPVAVLECVKTAHVRASWKLATTVLRLKGPRLYRYRQGSVAIKQLARARCCGQHVTHPLPSTPFKAHPSPHFPHLARSPSLRLSTSQPSRQRVLGSPLVMATCSTPSCRAVAKATVKASPFYLQRLQYFIKAFSWGYPQNAATVGVPTQLHEVVQRLNQTKSRCQSPRQCGCGSNEWPTSSAAPTNPSLFSVHPVP